MAGDDIFRRLRGAVGNALVWGVGWFAAALALFATLRVVGILPATFSWGEVLGYAIRAGIVGGVVTGLFVPLFLQAMNLLSGDGFVPWELVLDDGLWTAVFGSVAAGGSLRSPPGGSNPKPPPTPCDNYPDTGGLSSVFCFRGRI